MQPAGWTVSIAMPCRPASHQRSIDLAGTRLDLRMLACEAGAHVYAVAGADVGDPSRVQAVLRALGEAARANVQGEVVDRQPAAVPGMTPSPEAWRWRLLGRRPDGQPVAEQVLVFAHGTRVYQATVLGPQAGAAQAAPFFDPIRVLR